MIAQLRNYFLALKSGWILLLVLFLVNGKLNGQQVKSLDVNAITQEANIESLFSELKLPIGEMNGSDLFAGKYNSQIKAADVGAMNIKGVDSWLILKLVNSGNEKKEIVVGTSRFDYLSFCFVDSAGTIEKTEGGLLFPNKEKRISEVHASFADAMLLPNQEKYLCIRLRNTREPSFDFTLLPIKVYEKSYFFEHRTNKRNYLFVIMGAILIMALYNLFIFFIVKDRAYIYYVGYNLMFCCFIAVNSGGLLQLICYDSSNQFTVVNYIGALSLIFYIPFAQKLLSIRHWYPRVSRFLRILFFFFCLSCLIIFLQFNTLALALNFSNTFITLNTITIVAAFIYYRHKFLPARYFLTALVFYFIGAITMCLQMLSILPAQIFGLGSIEVLETGEVLQLTFFSLSLASRFAVIREQLAKEELDKERLLRQKDQEIKQILEKENEVLEEKVEERTRELVAEKNKSEDLLLNLLPVETAEELKSQGFSKPKHIESVTVLFTDVKSFVKISEKLSPDSLVAELNYCFSAFDLIMQKQGVEKIKTIGDAYMAAGGLPSANKTHASDVVRAALDIQKFMSQYQKLKQEAGEPYFELRIGAHTGSVVAGIVGLKKFAYDIWGDTVNTASRMESAGEVGKVNISGTTYELIKDEFDCEYRGKVSAKGKGEIDMYFVKEKN
jgi:class 3 adenylate cyclase